MVYKSFNIKCKYLILIGIMLITSGCSTMNMFSVYSQEEIEADIDHARRMEELKKKN